MLQNIEMAGFKKACQKIRDELYVEDAEDFADLREMYRSNINPAFFRIERPEVRTAEKFRDELLVARIRAGIYAATDAQIETIMRLATVANDFARTGFSILSEDHAKVLIASYR